MQSQASGMDTGSSYFPARKRGPRAAHAVRSNPLPRPVVQLPPTCASDSVHPGLSRHTLTWPSAICPPSRWQGPSHERLGGVLKASPAQGRIPTPSEHWSYRVAGSCGTMDEQPGPFPPQALWSSYQPLAWATAHTPHVRFVRGMPARSEKLPLSQRRCWIQSMYSACEPDSWLCGR